MPVDWTPELIARVDQMRAAGRSFKNIDIALGIRLGATYQRFFRSKPENREKENAYRRELRRQHRMLRPEAPQGSAGGEGRFTVPDSAFIERDARYAALARGTVTQRLLGDPPPGYSALDRMVSHGR